jgi:hypothetical protein
MKEKLISSVLFYVTDRVHVQVFSSGGSFKTNAGFVS